MEYSLTSQFSTSEIFYIAFDSLDHALVFCLEYMGYFLLFLFFTFMQSSVLSLDVNSLENYFLQISICSLLAFQSPIPLPCPKGEKHSASCCASALS